MSKLLARLMAFLIVFSTCFSSCYAAGDYSMHAPWDAALHKYVSSDGLVNYANWTKDHDELDAYLKTLATFKTSDYVKLSREEKLALWINAYNAFTVKQILDHYPIKRSGLNFYPDNSIRQIDGVWDKQKMAVAGRSVSLSQIENEILRQQFKEPLIHFAINCASKSCPKLQKQAYRAEMLKEQLDKSAREFLADTGRNKIDAPHHRIELSKIFDWFGDDFKALYGSAHAFSGRSAKEQAILNFITQYTDDKTRLFVASNRFTMSYLPYDWSLNEGSAK